MGMRLVEPALALVTVLQTGIGLVPDSVLVLGDGISLVLVLGDGISTGLLRAGTGLLRVDGVTSMVTVLVLVAVAVLVLVLCCDVSIVVRLVPEIPVVAPVVALNRFL